MSRTFNSIEAGVLTALGQDGSGGPVEIRALAERLGADQSPVAGAVASLEQDGLVAVTESAADSLRAGSRAEGWGPAGAPERRVARALAAAGGSAGIRELPDASGLDAREIGQSLRWLAARVWAVNEKGTLRLADGWPTGGDEPALDPDERLVAHLLEHGEAGREELAAAGFAVEEALQLLSKRSGVLDVRSKRRRFVSLTGAGRSAARGGIEARPEVNELTGELLVSGRWRDVTFRRYDVSLPASRPAAGREHPFRRILEATRRAYLDLGFEETASPFVESGFWDFDALFQPQDHPARDMQDTFYVARPGRADLPAADLVERVRRTHEDGGETGSTGWRYAWDRELAGRTVLRTHTTSATIRELARDPSSPRRVFCVGPVFRRETIDYKHLPVFHQVDGIVVDESASFASLLTLLATFYRKMGFEKIQFRPAFFPYTEPSVEVFVWMESRSDWVEMGGAGVFRAEVTEPLGCSVPVLAWGLGLERLAMFRFELGDIRDLYLASLGWLERVPACRS